MIKNKKQIVTLIAAILLGATLAATWSDDAHAIIVPVTVDGEELYDEEGQNVNTAGTAIYDYNNDTLILNNYNGGRIAYAKAADLTIVLRGTNKLMLSGSYDDYCGLDVGSAEDGADPGIKFTGDGTLLVKNAYARSICADGNIEINNTDVTIDNDASVTVGMYAGYDFVMNGGNLTIKKALNAISTEVFTINNGNFVTEDVVFGTNVSEAYINGGNLLINAEVAGMIALGRIEINGGYLDINAGTEGTAAAIVAVAVNAQSNIAIAEGMHILTEGVSVQTASLTNGETGPTSAFTLGQAGATITLNGLSGTATNTANKVVIAPDYTYAFTEGDNQKLVVAKISNYTFTIDANYLWFDSLSIGDLSLEKDVDYIVASGSAIVDFTESGIGKLNTLKVGTYDVLARFTNNKVAQGTLTILEKNPNTGDDIISWIVLGLVSMGGMMGAVLVAKK